MSPLDDDFDEDAWAAYHDDGLPLEYPCLRCRGGSKRLGTLGRRDSWRCRQCGYTFQTATLEGYPLDPDDTEPDGECFRGRESEAYLSECLEQWQRELK